MATPDWPSQRLPHRKDLQLVNIGVEYAVDEADAGRLVRVLVGELDMDFPRAAFERGCSGSGAVSGPILIRFLFLLLAQVCRGLPTVHAAFRFMKLLTLLGSLEYDVEFLPARFGAVSAPARGTS